MPSVASPCIKVCVLDPRSGLCTGCGRTLDEIAGWLSMTPTERAGIIDAAPRRLARAVAVAGDA